MLLYPAKVQGAGYVNLPYPILAAQDESWEQHYVTTYEHFNEHRSILKMTMGSADLDSLIDSIQEGQFYLFYGSNKGVIVTMSDQISAYTSIFDVVVAYT